MVPVDYELKDNDLIENLSHRYPFLIFLNKPRLFFSPKKIWKIDFRHENLVLNQPIEIVLEDENVLVINKPCSIPVRFFHYFFTSPACRICAWGEGRGRGVNKPCSIPVRFFNVRRALGMWVLWDPSTVKNAQKFFWTLDPLPLRPLRMPGAYFLANWY
jgi:hypothetical protein